MLRSARPAQSPVLNSQVSPATRVARGARFLLAAALLAGPGAAQFPRPFEPLGSESVVFEPESGPPFDRVRWTGFPGTAPLPLVPSATAIDVFGVDRSLLVVMTGGLDGEPLTFRLLDRRTGAIERVPSLPDALRLPSDFGGIPGSRPLLVAPGVLLIAWDAGGALNYRVRTLGQLLGGSGRDVSLEAVRLETVFDPDRRTIDLRFLARDGRVVDESRVMHPERGRLAVSPGDRLDFGLVPVGRAAVRSILLRNTGRTALVGLLRAEGPHFSLVGPTVEAERLLEVRLEPGRFAAIAVRWQPTEVTDGAVGRLVYDPQVPDAGFQLAMSGVATATLSTEEPDSPARDEPATEVADLKLAEAPRARDVELSWAEPGVVELRGRLAAGRERTVEVLVSGRAAGQLRLDTGGVFRFVTPAKVGDRIALRWPGDPRTRALTEVPHAVLSRGSALVLLARPGEWLRLVERIDVGSGRFADLRTWSVRADAAGRARSEPKRELGLDRVVVQRRGEDGDWIDVPIRPSARDR